MGAVVEQFPLKWLRLVRLLTCPGCGSQLWNQAEQTRDVLSANTGWACLRSSGRRRPRHLVSHQTPTSPQAFNLPPPWLYPNKNFGLTSRGWDPKRHCLELLFSLSVWEMISFLSVPAPRAESGITPRRRFSSGCFYGSRLLLQQGGRLLIRFINNRRWQRGPWAPGPLLLLPQRGRNDGG